MHCRLQPLPRIGRSSHILCDVFLAVVQVLSTGTCVLGKSQFGWDTLSTRAYLVPFETLVFRIEECMEVAFADMSLRNAETSHFFSLVVRSSADRRSFEKDIGIDDERKIRLDTP